MANGGAGGAGRWEDIRVSLGPQDEVTGKLSFATPTRIEGRLKGQLRATDLLVIGPQASIEASVEADQLIVLGEVRGDVTATSRLEICNGGKLFGDVATKALVIREGGIFEGYSRMPGSPAAVSHERSPVHAPVDSPVGSIDDGDDARA